MVVLWDVYLVIGCFPEKLSSFDRLRMYLGGFQIGVGVACLIVLCASDRLSDRAGVKGWCVKGCLSAARGAEARDVLLSLPVGRQGGQVVMTAIL